MVEHRLFLTSNDALGRTSSAVQWEVSTDGNQFRLLSAAELRAGLPISPGKNLTVRSRQRGLFGVTQELTLSGDGSRLDCVGERDFGTVTATSTPPQEVPSGQARHTYVSCLSMFRDALPDRELNHNNPPPPYMYTVLAFGDSSILSDGGQGLGRLSAGRAVNVLSYGDNIGRLFYLKTPGDSGKPQLTAVFVPSGLDLSQPVPIHLYYSPSTGGKKLPYPYSDGDNSFNAMIHNYLIGGGKRFLSQHVASGKSCVFAFPIPSPHTYFTNVQSATSVRSFCLELVYYLRKTLGTSADSLPALGTCALSGFSEGGRPLSAVLGSSPTGTAFPELREVYLLDVMPPSGSSADTGSYHRLMGLLNGWWASGKGARKVRFYSQFYGFGLPLALRGKVVASNAGAVEFQAAGATCLFTPKRFWTLVEQEQSNLNTNPGYNLDSIHQLMPCLFLEHALKNSGFPDR